MCSPFKKIDEKEWRTTESALIVSSGKNTAELIFSILSRDSFSDICVLKNAVEARRLLTEKSYDLCVVICPLADESGEKLAVAAAQCGICQAIAVVPADESDSFSARFENRGVYTVCEPVSRSEFISVLRLAGAAHNRLIKLNAENKRLQQKIDDIRLIDRAKCLLIEYLKLSEYEAHRYMEKQAMDLRISRRQVAENILKTYEG